MELETLDLGQADSMPLLCRSVSMLDHFLVIVFMYYTASLFIYLFCRKPNPDVPHTSEMTLRVHAFCDFLKLFNNNFKNLDLSI